MSNNYTARAKQLNGRKGFKIRTAEVECDAGATIGVSLGGVSITKAFARTPFLHTNATENSPIAHTIFSHRSLGLAQ